MEMEGSLLMKTQCDKCEKPATIHLTEIVNGEKIEKHLCEDCAASEGITIKANLPISQLLEDFVMQADEAEGEGGESTQKPRTAKEILQCDVCGMRFSEFQENGQLGCPHDYTAFEKPLVHMLGQAHAGQTQHIGKVPRRRGDDQAKQNQILRLRADLKAAISAEQYERAASLRDEIKAIEAQS